MQNVCVVRAHLKLFNWVNLRLIFPPVIFSLSGLLSELGDQTEKSSLKVEMIPLMDTAPEVRFDERMSRLAAQTPSDIIKNGFGQSIQFNACRCIARRIICGQSSIVSPGVITVTVVFVSSRTISAQSSGFCLMMSKVS